MFDTDDLYVIPLDEWVSLIVEWIATNLRPLFLAIRWPVEALLSLIEGAFQGMPYPLVILAIAVLAWAAASRGVALFSALALLFILFTGVWPEAMTTLALIVTALVVCIVVGLPIGIASARSDRVWRYVRPVLDVMQTMPSFVYLVPVVMLFGVGTVAGGIAVIISAIPPLIRFTNIGIREVDTEIVEAGRAFGATSRQLLTEIQLPLAMPTILGGLNQTVLTAMAMSVIASMIGAEGLGLVVLQGLGRLDVGRAAVGGTAIVLLAILLDRVTQGVAARSRSDGAAAPGLMAVLRSLVLPGLRAEPRRHPDT